MDFTIGSKLMFEFGRQLESTEVWIARDTQFNDPMSWHNVAISIGKLQGMYKAVLTVCPELVTQEMHDEVKARSDYLFSKGSSKPSFDLNRPAKTPHGY